MMCILGIIMRWRLTPTARNRGRSSGGMKSTSCRMPPLLAALLLLFFALPAAHASSIYSLSVAMVCAADMKMIPLQVTDRMPASILGLIYEPLVTLDDERAPTPMLAERWDYVGGGQWDITLRQDVSFTNGAKLTAHDVVATLNAISALAQDGQGLYQEAANVLSGWEATSDNVVRLRAKNTSYMILHALNFPILPSGYTESECPPGTGPYRIEYYLAGSQMLLSANEQWWQKPTAIQALTVKWYKTDAEAMNAFQLENVDILSTRSLSATRYRGILSSEITSLQYSTRQLEMVLFNNSSKRLKEVDMRRAVSAAIDKGRIAATVYQNVVSATDTIVMPGTYLYNDDAQKYYYNPEHSNKLLDAMGYTARDESGFRLDAEGNRLALRLFYYDEEGSSFRRQAAFLIDDMLAQVGIDVSITYYLFENGKAKLESGDFDMYLCGFNFGVVPDPSFLVSRGSAMNYARYRSDDVTKLLDALAKSPTREEFAKAWRDLQAKINEDQPFLPLYFRGGMLIMRGGYLTARDIREFETLRTFAEANR